MLTQERLKEVLGYDPETGMFRWKMSPAPSVNIGDTAGHKHIRGYIQIGINGKRHRAHRLAYLYTHGYIPEYGIDHIDRNPSNNRIDNLREVSQQCNMRNTGNYCTNTSGCKGVYWNKHNNRWCAQITVNGKRKYLGTYDKDDFASAVYARHTAETCLGWSGCDSSSPAYKWIQNNLKGSRHE